MKKTNAMRILDRAGITYERLPYTYFPDGNVIAQIAQAKGLVAGDIYKTLVAKGDRTGVIVAVVPGDASLSLKALAQVSGNRKAALVAVSELQPLTGYLRGGCSPLGMKKEYPIFIDQRARQRDLIYVNAGLRGMLIGVHPLELARVCSAQWADLTP